jgi:excisionase family DNA binding protein
VNLPNTSEQTIDRAIDGLLTKRGLAPRLEISTRTLDDWMRRGFVPYIKIGKSVRFRLADVLEKLNARRVN